MCTATNLFAIAESNRNLISYAMQQAASLTCTKQLSPHMASSMLSSTVRGLRKTTQYYALAQSTQLAYWPIIRVH